ncbi:MAG: acyltransferase [Rhizomicrobium sp.]
MTDPGKNLYQPHLDGLRGLMALWVFVGHAAQLAGFRTALIPNPGMAVDVFMFLSGLLMTRNFIARRDKEPLSSAKTIRKFMIRRFFRIAPLYYPVLLAAFAIWFVYGQQLGALGQIFPPPWTARLVNDPSLRDVTLTNVLAHLTFVFGLFPQYSANTMLPDWSLSLEMQFYLVLPFILLLCERIGYTVVVLVLMGICFLTNHYVGLYLNPTPLGDWPQPSFLAFKINCFLAGVLMAVYFGKRSTTILVLMFATTFLAQKWPFSVIVLFAFLAMDSGRDSLLERTTFAFKNVLSSSPARFLGDISYSVYLIHLLIVTPVFWLLVTQMASYRDLPAPVRFALLFAIAAAVVIPLSYVLYRTVELWGIELGRRLTREYAVPHKHLSGEENAKAIEPA